MHTSADIDVYSGLIWLAKSRWSLSSIRSKVQKLYLPQFGIILFIRLLMDLLGNGRWMMAAEMIEYILYVCSSLCVSDTRNLIAVCFVNYLVICLEIQFWYDYCVHHSYWIAAYISLQILFINYIFSHIGTFKKYSKRKRNPTFLQFTHPLSQLTFICENHQSKQRHRNLSSPNGSITKRNEIFCNNWKWICFFVSIYTI